MNSATTNLTTPPARPHGLSPRSVPTIEDLYQMTSEPDEGILFHDVDWSFYEQLLDSIPEGCHIHIDYDGKDLEIIMSPGIVHDDKRGLLGRVVELIAEECGIPLKSTGQTTWKHPESNAGSNPTKATTSEKKSSTRWRLPRRGDPMTLLIIPTLISASRSICRHRKPTDQGSTPLSGFLRSGVLMDRGR